MGYDMGAVRKPGARALKPVLEQFSRLVRRSTDADPGYAPFLFNERTLVGTLAAAAWAAGGMALEEYSAMKGRAHTRRAGRVDVWIRTPSGREFVVEAKRTSMPWHERTAQFDIADRVDDILDSASVDVRASPSDGGHRIGMAFIVPAFREFDRPVRAVRQFLNDAEFSSWDVWCWSRSGRVFHDGRAAYPGVLVVGKMR